MYLIAVFFPVLSLIVVSLLSWGYLTPWCSNVGIFSSLIISLLLSVYALYEVVYLNATCAVECAPWFEFGTLQITWSFLFDKFNTITFFLVISISLCVHVFALTYLNDDPHLSRFLLLLYFFTVFMQILVTAGNFMQLFVGWEGVGLISYLLINFWFTRYEAVNSGLMAIIYNRVGDCGFILALCLVLYFLKTNDFLVFSSCNLYTNMIILQIFDVNIKLIDFIIIGFTIGTIGKSAQIFLECWLSLAMEGPTPVSSLLHAATLVISGLIILCRIFLVIQNSFIGMNFLVLLGALTSFFAATTGLFMVDIKRVIAYSTCSQLGYLVFCIGLSQFDVAIFHLINHAFFKCLLFIGAGFIIHALSNEQDLRKLGSLFKLLPYIFVLMCFSSIALMGLPFFSGFFSKEKILESSFYIFNELNLISFWLGCLSALCTAIYSTKLLYLSFFATPNNTNLIILFIFMQIICIS
jgi:NADH-quinone oxidoreductase subunit L